MRKRASANHPIVPALTFFVVRILALTRSYPYYQEIRFSAFILEPKLPDIGARYSRMVVSLAYTSPSPDGPIHASADHACGGL